MFGALPPPPPITRASFAMAWRDVRRLGLARVPMHDPAIERAVWCWLSRLPPSPEPGRLVWVERLPRPAETGRMLAISRSFRRRKHVTEARLSIMCQRRNTAKRGPLP